MNLVDVRGGIGGKCGGSISLRGVGFSLVRSGWGLWLCVFTLTFRCQGKTEKIEYMAENQAVGF